MIEYVGYLASIFLGISLIVKDSLKFRIFNSLGCLAFVIYGIMLKANPVILANGILLVLNVFQLIKMLREKKA